MLATLSLGTDPVALAARAPLVHREGGYVGSGACLSCHADHHASWRATFHSTMTQLPSPETVLGAFDGRVVRYEGNEARPLRSGDRFVIELPDGRGGRRAAEVALLVGSRRYQQYFEREPRGGGEALLRLPILWHVAAARWLPLNAVFLEPDDARFESHRSSWNDNCILCHNTGPRPSMLNYLDPARQRTGGAFASRVGELGIACESCHGPGAAHVAARRGPVARYAARFAAAPDPTIVDPLHLDQEHAVSACGQCHGARLPEPLARWADWMTTGPTFRAGDRLRDHVAPIGPDTPVRGGADPELFQLRFWRDGTPRLTAYELQGVTRSACYRSGELTCTSCHAMHSGDPRGQLRPDRAGDRMCTQCHEAIGRDPVAHTHHGAGGPGSACVECHMPRIVYGILDVHRSHRIESPDPRRDAENGRPHACTLCHADRTLAWSAEQMRRLWKKPFAEPSRRRDGAPLELPDALASLLAGDAAQRAIYAAALGRAVVTTAPPAAAELRACLAVTLGDGYPSVRWLAQRSLQALEKSAPLGLEPVLAAIDHTQGQEQRRRDVLGLLEAFARQARGRLPPPAAGALLGPDFRLDLGRVVRLCDLQAKDPIAIGE